MSEDIATDLARRLRDAEDECALLEAENAHLTAQVLARLPADLHGVLRDIVFGTKLSAVVEFEEPRQIIQLTAKRIWDNLECFLLTGDWPDAPIPAVPKPERRHVAHPATNTEAGVTSRG
uniref:hypothetical protein n=1 Tax=Nonomuraea sp. CA-251285 TaxID=3240002 RepID=UPI003F494751